MFRLPISSVLVLALSLAICFGPAAAWSDQPEPTQPTLLENWLALHPDVFSGATPRGPTAFAELRQRGIRTIISVDGAGPNLNNASDEGLRYVHIPIGYDGIDDKTKRTLATAVAQLPKPIYFHCHHGQHRGPAAAVAACIATGRIDSNRGETWLRTAGTSSDYGGLYRSISSTRRLDDDLLAQPTQFVASVEPDDLVATMLKLESHFAQLEDALENKQLADQRRQATLIAEVYRELNRVSHGTQDPRSFSEAVRAAESTAEKLRSVMARKAGEDVTTPIYRRMRRQCKLCHEQFRD